MASADSLPIWVVPAAGMAGLAVGLLSWRDARRVDEASIVARARRTVRAEDGDGRVVCAIVHLSRCLGALPCSDDCFGLGNARLLSE